MVALFKSLIIKFQSFITYSIVGVVNTSIDFLVFTVLIFFNTDIIVAQAVAYASGLVSSFFLNKYVTFKNTAKSFIQTILFLLVNGVTMLTSMVAMYFFYKVIGIQEYIVKFFLITPIVMLLNYSGFRCIVFAERKNKNQYKKRLERINRSKYQRLSSREFDASRNR